MAQSTMSRRVECRWLVMEVHLRQSADQGDFVRNVLTQNFDSVTGHLVAAI
jgi:hypothetical protein